MSLEMVLLPASLLLSGVGIYLNLCFQRATHRSTVYAKFLCRNLRFLSLFQLVLAFSNIIFTAAMWGSRANRTKKSEAFFSATLALTRAVPAASIFWIAVERVLYNRVANIRDSVQFRYIAIFRVVQILGSIALELAVRGAFEGTEDFKNLYLNHTELEPGESEEDGTYLKNSLIANFYIDWVHLLMFLFSACMGMSIYYLANSSHKRAALIGGMRNDQKITNLRQQMTFFKRSFSPLLAGCFADFLVLLLVKRGLGLDEPTTDVLYILSRSLLPIIFPIALISCHSNLRVDFIGNIFLCRKARNMHKESKVKVIATKESQESIIANLKMIGILSDVDTAQPGAPGVAGISGVPMGISRPQPISKDPSSNTSMGSTAKLSNAGSLGGSGPAMMFTTRPKMSVNSMGNVG